MILIKFSQKKMVFWAQIKGNFAENVIITLVLEKNANFFGGKRQKSQKILTITSVPAMA
jgi:hypothetical protein